MSDEPVVHVVDDDDAVRRALAFLLATDGLAVRVHASAVAFLEGVAVVSGCVLTDVRMPDIDGIELLRRLKRRGSPAPVIVMTGHADVPLAVQAMREGARDFIEKPFDDEVLLASVRSALAQADRGAGQAAERDATRTRLAALTERERQVLDGLVAGKANKVIGLDLGISPRTVEIYRANVMSKLQAGSLSELVRMALVADRGPAG
ncbi:response regulator FixJ [Methylobacterium radiotolerans]|uniref:Two component transcriptional regulator, LuxR family n=1 Tax=Methylobacterium radiotolerans (strain ATCC 27329 / DSM 1819 / JCM 2831 / NBRC 15690 / NCIMB 10815 / 0-1) TaxID=426355 RepID=B1M117_METRJ|nr:response regulator FixJ [Methylobacterium radiotolerans]ACB24567.1 two component transcriptional regulator, LuxR family [Methylobacterium radiotolerans JCM 2831]GEN00913.1 DNA-binding response regulator [Methylobacterium radiotolerans]